MLRDHMARSNSAAHPEERSRKPWVFLFLDLVFAAIYIGVAPLAHSADGRFEAGSLVLGIALALAGAGIAVRRPWGWWLSVAGCAVVLLGAVILLLLLGASIGFLWGTFGAIGKGAASMTLIIMALVIEIYVLVPGFQLAHLLSARGRAIAGRAPVA
jgi:hypothetical protein